MKPYPYGWSINITINPSHWVMLIVWIGNTQYVWQAKHPLAIEKDTMRGDRVVKSVHPTS